MYELGLTRGVMKDNPIPGARVGSRHPGVSTIVGWLNKQSQGYLGGADGGQERGRLQLKDYRHWQSIPFSSAETPSHNAPT